MSKPRLSNPTIFTLLRMYFKEHRRIPELMKQTNHKFDYSTYLLSLAAVVVLSSMLPKDLVDADTFKFGVPLWQPSKFVYVASVDADMQKSIDLFKSNPKVEYITKYRTIPFTIWQYLTDDMGLNDIQAAGIFGNMMVESGYHTFNINPYVYSPGNAYYGICQWNTHGHHSSINGGTLDEQLDYLNDTIEGEMGDYGYQQFISADSPEEASVAFGRWYERCGSPSGRQNEARSAYERFGG